MKNLNIITIVLLTGFATSACTTPKMVDKQFGSSVRNMVKQQVYDPSTLHSPPTDQIAGQNSYKAIIDQRKVYRTSDVSKSETKVSSRGGGK